MTYVVAEPCIKCKYTDCVAACPVDCFREGENFLVIDPGICIDCGACVDPCPTKAIFPEDDLPEKWEEYKELNVKLAAEWPEISAQKDPMPEAAEFNPLDKAFDKKHENKRSLLSEKPFEG